MLSSKEQSRPSIKILWRDECSGMNYDEILRRPVAFWPAARTSQPHMILTCQFGQPISCTENRWSWFCPDLCSCFS